LRIEIGLGNFELVKFRFSNFFRVGNIEETIRCLIKGEEKNGVSKKILGSEFKKRRKGKSSHYTSLCRTKEGKELSRLKSMWISD